MQLLVSVRNAGEALRALEGGADLIDAKDPASGPLGAVAPGELEAIRAAVAGRRPVTAALGDIDDPETAASLAERYSAAGTAFLKVGVAGIPDPAIACSLLAAALAGARRGAPGAELVAAAYADTPAGSLGPGELIGIAARAGANGILVDTADKGGPGLRDLVDGNTLESWVREAHALGLSVAIAGRLGRDDLEWVARSGADIAGVRGAACRDGRTGQIEVERVRTLRALCGAPPGLAPEARSG